MKAISSLVRVRSYWPASLVLAVLLMFTLGGCGGGSMTTMDSKDSRTLVFNGKINNESGEPASNIEVSLVNDPSGIRKAVTDQDGYFKMSVTSSSDNSQKVAQFIFENDSISNSLVISDISTSATSIKFTAVLIANSSQAELVTVEIKNGDGQPQPTKTPNQTSAGQNQPTPEATPLPAEAQPTPTLSIPIVSPTPGLQTPEPTPNLLAPPTNLKASVKISNASLTWQVGASNSSALQGFNIYRSMNGGVFDLVASVGSQSNQFIDSLGTNKSETVKYRMTTLSSDGEGAASDPVLVVPLANLNGDNCVNQTDQSLFSSSLDSCSGSANFIAQADFNGDGCITLSDAISFTNWIGWCS